MKKIFVAFAMSALLQPTLAVSNEQSYYYCYVGAGDFDETLYYSEIFRVSNYEYEPGIRTAFYDYVTSTHNPDANPGRCMGPFKTQRDAESQFAQNIRDDFNKYEKRVIRTSWRFRSR